MKSSQFSLSNAIKDGISLMINHLNVLIPTFFIMITIMLVKTFLIFGLYDWSLIEKLYKLRNVGVVLQPMVVVVRPHIWFISISFLLLYALYLFFYLGTIKIIFNLYDSGTSRKRILFSSLSLMPKALLTSIIVYILPFAFGFIIGLPLFLLNIKLPDSVIPLFIFGIQVLVTIYLTAVTLWQYILVDKKIGGLQAVRMSYYLLKGNILKLTGIYIVIRFFTKIFPYGDIITWPIIFLAEICILVIIYRQLTTQEELIIYNTPEFL